MFESSELGLNRSEDDYLSLPFDTGCGSVSKLLDFAKFGQIRNNIGISVGDHYNCRQEVSLGDSGPTSGVMRASKECKLKLPDRAIKSLTLSDGAVTAHAKAAAKFKTLSDGFGRPM